MLTVKSNIVKDIQIKQSMYYDAFYVIRKKINHGKKSFFTYNTHVYYMNVNPAASQNNTKYQKLSRARR